MSSAREDEVLLELLVGEHLHLFAREEQHVSRLEPGTGHSVLPKAEGDHALLGVIPEGYNDARVTEEPDVGDATSPAEPELQGDIEVARTVHQLCALARQVLQERQLDRTRVDGQEDLVFLEGEPSVGGCDLRHNNSKQNVTDS